MRNALDIKIAARGPLRLRPLSAVRITLAVLALASIMPMPASAFEIFGHKFFEGDKSDEIPVTDPLTYTVDIEVKGGEGGDELRDKLTATSSLSGGVDKPVSGSVGLISRATGDFEQLVGALYEDARYGGVVKIYLAGKPLETMEPDTDLSASEPVPVRIVVDPGPQFRFGKVVIKADDGHSFNPSDYGLTEGDIAGSQTILNAENRLEKDLRNEGRPLAKVVDRDVVADHARNVVDLTLSVKPGPVAAFGETTVDGTKDVDAAFVARMTGIEPGKTYSPAELDKATKRLQQLDVFATVNVNGRKQLAADGSVPVDVKVSERKPRYIGIGATFSSTDGGGLEAYWGHRNLFGHAEKLRVEGSISGLGATSEVKDLTYHGAILFEKPGVLGPASKFTSKLAVEQEDPDAYRRFSVLGQAGITRELSDERTVSAGVEVEYARLTDSFDVERETLTVALPLEFVHDGRDNRLNPTKGYRVLLGIAPAWETIGSNGFVTLRGEASTYYALDEAKRFVLAGRVGVGSIIGSELADIPANRRFYAGGGGSVRGFGYQGIGPRDMLGNPTGGRSKLEASAEVRIGITDTIGIVPFVDAGMVSEDSYFSGGELKVGAGLGLRYKTPFGPLRLDVAVPLVKDENDPDYGIYAGIGQAF